MMRLFGFFGICVFANYLICKFVQRESVPNSSNLLGKHHEMSLRLIYNLKERNWLVDKFTNYTSVRDDGFGWACVWDMWFVV